MTEILSRNNYEDIIQTTAKRYRDYEAVMGVRSILSWHSDSQKTSIKQAIGELD